MDETAVQLRDRVRQLEGVVTGLNEALRESTKLLVRLRPSRPPIPHERKLLVAASQGWKCKNPFDTCPLYRLGDGYFDESLFECDHTVPHHQCYRNDKAALQCLCPYCHNVKSRRERLALLEAGDEEEEAS